MRACAGMLGWIALVLSTVACGDTHGNLVTVRIYSDFAAGTEAQRAVVDLLAGDLDEAGARHAHVERVLNANDSLTDGSVFLVVEDVPTGHYTARAALQVSNGVALVQQSRAFDVHGDVSINIFLTADCSGVVCDGACVRGTCVAPECTPEMPALCPPNTVCTTDVDCGQSASPCAQNTCVEGTCLQTPIDGMCGSTEYCARDVGCAPVDMPVTRPDTDNVCGTICRLQDEPCWYGYFVCSDNEERTAVCAPLVRRPAGVSCGNGAECNADGVCVAVAPMDAGMDASTDASTDATTALRDASLDASRDASSDAARDANADGPVPVVHPEAGVAIVEDAGVDASVDASIDATMNEDDAATSASDAGADSNVHSGPPGTNECTALTDTCLVTQACDDQDDGYICRNPVSLAAGSQHTCALFEGGIVKCWGENMSGQLGYDDYGVRNTPPTIVVGRAHEAPMRAVQIAAGGDRTCAILLDGNLACWGANTNGALGYGDTTARRAPAADPITFGSGITATHVSVGSFHTCVTLSDGNVTCWGLGFYRALGYSDTSDRYAPSSPVDIGGSFAQSVTASYYRTCVVVDDGNVKCWGNSATDGAHTISMDLTYISPSPTSAISVAATENGDTCALRDDGSIACWTGIDDDSAPYGVNFGMGRTVRSLVAAGRHMCAILDDDSLRCWGNASGSMYGQLGYNDVLARSWSAAPPVQLPSGRTVRHVAVGQNHTCVIRDDNAIQCWGNNAHHELGYAGGTYHRTPLSRPVTLGGSAVDIAAGWNHTCALLDSGDAKCWGWNVYGELGTGDYNTRIFPPDPPISLGSGIEVSRVYAGASMSSFITSTGAQIRYGNGIINGTLNHGTSAHVTKAGNGAGVECSLFDDGTMRCWGDNTHGQLGYADNTSRNTLPVPAIDFGGGTVALDFATGNDFVCAIVTGGQVRCWGYNANGELGYGDYTYRNSADGPAIDLGVGAEAAEVVAGWSHACARLSNGDVKCWGRNDSGQLGCGDTIYRASPPSSAVALGEPAVTIASGSAHVCAILMSGNLKCWGWANYQGIGYSDTANSYLAPPSAPIDLGAGRTAVAVAAGLSHTCAVLDDDSVKCWGNNDNGQLGDGTGWYWAPPEEEIVNARGH